MPARGPHPTPTNLKGGGKMRPPAYSLCKVVPDPPKWLKSTAAQNEWRSKAEELFDRGALTEMCLTPLAIYCHVVGEYQDTVADLDENGRTYERSDFTYMRPEVGRLNKLAELITKLGKEFGFTPGSQSRIAIVGERDDAGERDPIAAVRREMEQERGEF